MRKNTAVWMLLVVALSGCESTVDEQNAKLEEAQKQADTQTAKAVDEARMKTEAAQKEADAKTAKAAEEVRVKTDAAQKDAKEKVAEVYLQNEESAEKARKDANQTAREANETALQQRVDFEVVTNKSINRYDREVERIRSQMRTADPDKRLKVEAMLPKIDAQRAVVASDLAGISKTTPQSLPDFKAKTDRDMSELKKAVESAASSL